MNDFNIEDFKVPNVEQKTIWKNDSILALCLSFFTFTRLKRIRLINSDFYRESSRIQNKIAGPLRLNTELKPSTLTKNNNLSMFVSTFCRNTTNIIPFTRFHIDLSKNVVECGTLWRDFFQKLNKTSCFVLTVCFDELNDTNDQAHIEKAAALRSGSLALRGLRHLAFRLQFHTTFEPHYVNIREFLSNNFSISHLQVHVWSKDGLLTTENVAVSIVKQLEFWNPPDSRTYLTELSFEFVPISARLLHELAHWTQRIKKLKLGQFANVISLNQNYELYQVLTHFAETLVQLEIVLAYDRSDFISTPLCHLDLPNMPMLLCLKFSCPNPRLVQSIFLSKCFTLNAKLPHLFSISFENIFWIKSEPNLLPVAQFNSVRYLQPPAVMAWKIKLTSNSFVFTSMFPNLTTMVVALHGKYMQVIFSLCPLLTTLNIYNVTNAWCLDDIFTGMPKVNQFCVSMGLSPKDNFRPYYTESLPSILQLRSLSCLQINVMKRILLSDISIYNALLRLKYLAKVEIIVAQTHYEPMIIFSDQGLTDLKGKLNFSLEFVNNFDKTS